MKKTYNVDVLSPKSINNLIKQLTNYRDELKIKSAEFVKRLTEIGIQVIDQRMESANFTVDEKGFISGSDSTHHTYVKVKSTDTRFQATLTVEGEDLLFIEFGAGVHYNGSAGQSPHPKGGEFGYTIGSYGKGYGKQEYWNYADESGNVVVTYGTKATMPVYSASLQIIADCERIAREVFG